MSAPVPGTAGPLGEGELVLLVDRKQRRYLQTLEPGTTWHSHAGMLDHVDLIGRWEGEVLRTTGNMEVAVYRPTRADFVMKMRRGAQVIYPKDQAAIIERGDIRPGMTVAEAGAGSGALTMALLDAVGPTGRVISFERRDDHLEVAVENVTTWFRGHPDNWEPRAADAVDGIADTSPHRIVLDMLEPWLVLPSAAAALSPGGLLVAYMPTVTQVMRFDQKCRAQGGFAHNQTTETMVRGWDVENLAVRPHHRMVAHTAFLTTTRRVPSQDQGGPVLPVPPRGATVRFVDAEPGHASARDGDAGSPDRARRRLP